MVSAVGCGRVGDSGVAGGRCGGGVARLLLLRVGDRRLNFFLGREFLGEGVNPIEIKKEAEPVQVGDAVWVVDESYQGHYGLVTTVHGGFEHHVPCINVVFISGDLTKRDPYGVQTERLSSLQHYSQGPNNMPTPGRFWSNL